MYQIEWRSESGRVTLCFALSENRHIYRELVQYREEAEITSTLTRVSITAGGGGRCGGTLDDPDDDLDRDITISLLPRDICALACSAVLRSDSERLSTMDSYAESTLRSDGEWELGMRLRINSGVVELGLWKGGNRS